MTRYLFTSFLAASLLAVSPLISCTSQTTPVQQSAQTKGGNLSATDFNAKLNQTPDAQVVDVRTPKEFQGGHVHNALNLDWNSSDFSKHMQQLDKTKPTFVYCLVGGRSASAATELRKAGFSEVYEMDGGMMAWNKAQLPVQGGAQTGKPDEISQAQYQKHLQTDKLVLVDFNAPWCAPCRKMAPMLEDLKTEQAARMNLLVVNTDNNKALAASQKVQVLPTLVLYKNGQPVWRHEGYIGREELVAEIGKY